MVPKPSEVIALAEEIEEAQLALARLQKKWDALFAPAPTPKPLAGRPRRESFAARIVSLLKTKPTQSMSIESVAFQLKVNKLKTGRALFRLANTGKIYNTGRGMYRATSRAEADRLEQEMNEKELAEAS